jgi:hypothetical protein
MRKMVLEVDENDFPMERSLRETMPFYINQYIKKHKYFLKNHWKICLNKVINNRELTENRILGLIFLFNELSTEKVVEIYNNWFDDLSRSTISLYLNGLVRDKILNKKNDGNEKIFSLNNEVKIKKANPIWFTRNICPTPRYLYKIAYFEKKIITTKPDKELEFLIKIIQLNLIYNKLEKCLYCRFSNREGINSLKIVISNILEDKTNILSRELKDFLHNLGELALFTGDKYSTNVEIERLLANLLEI